tara:strand:+ start:745 stop:1401 length:657 start_codon:yes stop_codon:yes gene_type:complete
MIKYILFSLLLILIIPSVGFSDENEELAKADSQTFEEFTKAVNAVKEKNYELAADIFEKLAEDGDIDAQFNYAILTRNGLGRAQNYSQALYWSWLSFAGGLEKADKVLEKILELVPEAAHQEIRDKVSVFILNKINIGNRKALLHYGKFYLDILPEEDYNKAYLFYTIASAFGDLEAKEKRDIILENVDNEQIVEIQQKASLMFEKLRKGEKIEPLKD